MKAGNVSTEAIEAILNRAQERSRKTKNCFAKMETNAFVRVRYQANEIRYDDRSLETV